MQNAEPIVVSGGKVKRSPAEKLKRTGGASAETSLSERLQELEAALAKNLITREEYYQLRQRIIDDEV